MPRRSLTGFLRLHLSRVTSSGRFVPEIDGLRFVAIASVMLFHVQGYIFNRVRERSGVELAPETAFDTVMASGAFGVNLFYVISGFILALPFAERDLAGEPRPGLWAYYLRRVLRLEPPYLISLLVYFPFRLWVKGLPINLLLGSLLASACYLHGPIYGTRSYVNEVVWTLEIEVQFYMLAPWLTLVFRIPRTAWRRCAIVAAVAAGALADQYLIGLGAMRMRLALPCYLHWFLLGFLLVDVYLVDWKKMPTRTAAWDAVGSAAWVGLLLLLPHWRDVRFVFPPIVLLAYLATFRGPLLNRVFRNPVIVTIGGMCYTFYLYHYLAMSAVGVVSMRLYRADWPLWANTLVQTLCMLPIVVPVCALLFAVSERPFMERDWPARLRGWFLRGPIALRPTFSKRR